MRRAPRVPPEPPAHRGRKGLPVQREPEVPQAQPARKARLVLRRSIQVEPIMCAIPMERRSAGERAWIACLFLLPLQMQITLALGRFKRSTRTVKTLALLPKQQHLCTSMFPEVWSMSTGSPMAAGSEVNANGDKTRSKNPEAGHHAGSV